MPPGLMLDGLRAAAFVLYADVLQGILSSTFLYSTLKYLAASQELFILCLFDHIMLFSDNLQSN